jgi:hypothetical protein
MAKTNRYIADRITVFRTAWKELAPQESFAGMTLAGFEAGTALPITLRDQILGLEKQLEGRKAERMTADTAANALLDLMVNSVRGTPQHGPDSSLYRALGYIRKSERRSGLTRKGVEKSPGANAA